MLIIQKKFPNIRLWNNATGTSYPLGPVRNLVTASTSLNVFKIKTAIKSLFPMKFGKIGSADITGIMPSGIRLEIEVKTGRGRQTKDQISFMKMIRERNGIYIVVNDTDDIEPQLEQIKLEYEK